MNIEAYSIEKLAGQRLMFGFEGTECNNDVRHLIKTLHAGGLILFKQNIQSPGQISRLCDEAQEYARQCGLPPLLVAIDQEGGMVARLSSPFTVFKGNPYIKSAADAEEFGRICASELLDVGINMNLAPVLDVAPKSFGSIMEGRMFGHSPERVAAMGNRVIAAMQAWGLMAVAKHFPGIGRTRIDSHLDLPKFEDDLESLESFDLLPFRSAILNNVSGIMLSHIYYPAIDAEWPASLSRIIAADLLRSRLGYQGLTLTDDLDMGAIAKNWDIATCIDRIIAAEIDIVLVCHKGPAREAAFDRFTRMMASSRKNRDKGAASVRRILNAKKQFLTSFSDAEP